LFAGRLTIGKGVGLLIETLSKPLKFFPDYKFYFVGEGPLKDNLIKLNKTNKNVHILGQISHENLLRLMSKVKLVLVPSLWPEPFGRVALEAISQGTPVVATRSGGLPEIVSDGKYGLSVDATASAVRKGIEKAIGESEKYRKNIKNDFGKIRRRFQKDIVNSYLNLYQKLKK